jgi:hypothetical protein
MTRSSNAVSVTDDERPTCTDCGERSPDTNTNYTLISSTGWRLERKAIDTGRGLAFFWRCPPCWRAHKQKSTEARSMRPPSRSR